MERNGSRPVPDVYSVEEVARAAGCSPAHVRRLIATGHLGTVDGTFMSHRETCRCLARLRDDPHPLRDVFGAVTSHEVNRGRSTRVSLAATTTAHGFVALAALALTALPLTTATDIPVVDRGRALARLVYVVEPGPGGGGGGGGLRAPLPAPPAEREGRSPVSSPVPPRERPVRVEPPEPPEPPPLQSDPAPTIVAPLMEARAERRDVRGVPVARPAPHRTAGPGDEGGVGAGAGRGVGRGRGAGVGPGAGSGIGGGPAGRGSGVTAPAIAEEITPDYTEEARRQRVEGEVILEVVVLADGTIGAVRVTRGLGYGLDESAVRAMRRWRFHPARLRGEPVPVTVEVAMEFRLR